MLKKNSITTFFAIAAILVLSSCMDGSNNRRGGSSNSISPEDKTPVSGLNIASACLCKNGALIDGSASCSIVSCIDSKLAKNKDKLVTYTTVTLGTDIYTPIWKANGKNFYPTTPLKSVCSLANYKCVINIDGIYYQVDANNVIDQTPKSDKQVKTITSSQMISNTQEKSVIELLGLRRPTNNIKFEIFLKDDYTGEFTSVYSSNDVELNIYEGDGRLSPSTLNRFYAYSCVQVHQGLAYEFSLETFNFSAPLKASPVYGPPYAFQQPTDGAPPQTWPFICHVNTPPITTPISWDVVSNPNSPKITGGLPETNGGTPYFRLNQLNTQINFWSKDEKDFKITAEAMIEGMQFDIERRAYNHFINHNENEEWIPQSIFSEFKYSLVPEPALNPIPEQSGEQIPELVVYTEAGQYFMEPQPTDPNPAPRFSYRCPSKEMLNTDEGRMASLKHILSSDTNRLQFETKPFFAACAEGVTYTNKISGAPPIKTDRKIFFISKDDISAILAKRVLAGAINQSQANQFEGNLFSSVKGSAPFSFTLEEVYALRNLPLILNQATKETLKTFSIVSPEIVTGSTTCYKQDKNLNVGYVFGCYPSEIP